MKNLEPTDLAELIDLMANINNQINKYQHVEKFLPLELKKQIEDFDAILFEEFDRRDKLKTFIIKFKQGQIQIEATDKPEAIKIAKEKHAEKFVNALYEVFDIEGNKVI